MWTIICDNVKTVGIGCQLIIGNRIQDFDWYRHWWPRMTLNGVMTLILCYFTEFDSFWGRSRQSGWTQTYDICRISSSTFGWNWPTLQRGLSAIAELLVTSVIVYHKRRGSAASCFLTHFIFFDILDGGFRRNTPVWKIWPCHAANAVMANPLTSTDQFSTHAANA